MLDIVPAESPLVVETQIRLDEVDDVEPGLAAEIRFVAFAKRPVPTAQGRVLKVSADRLVEERSGVPYYNVVIIFDEAARAVLPHNLHPGMPVQVTIPTKPRTALDYLLAPLADSMAGAFREP